uniref:Uncharacterized protein n=1 Tax=Arundo donax TaxID=35708 RepID=A0A0A8XNM7_ARUDO
MMCPSRFGQQWYKWYGNIFRLLEHHCTKCLRCRRKRIYCPRSAGQLNKSESSLFLSPKMYKNLTTLVSRSFFCRVH